MTRPTRISPIAFWAALVVVLIGPPSARADAKPDFNSLLVEAGATFAPPDGFVAVDVPNIEAFPFDKALRGPSGDLQIMYAVRPISRMEIDYNDPHSSAPSPNHIFPLVFGALSGVLSSGGHVPSREYPPKTAKQLFNADWAGAMTFDLEPKISADYRYGFLLGMHKNDKADIYTLILFNDTPSAKQKIDDLLANLVFDKSVPPAVKGELRTPENGAQRG